MVAGGNLLFLLSALLLLLVTATGVEAQELCSARPEVYVEENNEVDQLVETIVVEDGAVPFLDPSANLPFRLDGNQLLATGVLDYETTTTYVVKVTCRKPLLEYDLIIVVVVLNVNDNKPFFDASLYQIKVDELLKVGTGLDQFPAKDLDQGTTLYYELKPVSSHFKLASSENPQLVIRDILDYDKVQSVQLVLYAQDTPLSGPAGEVSFTASTTIQVTVVDVDNRPPWFQPCKKHPMNTTVVCQSAGYTSRVTLNEAQAGHLTLKPNSLHAIDGDTGINEAIIYSFLSGNEGGLFDINPTTGNISMLKPANVSGTISLTVLAAQTPTSSQFATTSLTISVQVKSLHKPKFQRPQYQGVVSSVGAMATDPTNEDEPLQIVALDEDYAILGGINPHIVYRVIGRKDFSIINGFLFMTNNVPETTLSLQVEAVDTSNDEKDSVGLSVEVKSDKVPIPPGGFGPGDMAALGATLGVLLLVCAVVIGVLICHLQRGKADWRKIHEASVFRSHLGQGSGGEKQGVQYTNEAFQHDDGGSVGSGGPYVTRAEQGPPNDTALESRATALGTLLDDDDVSQTSSDKGKEVKPILTKERRLEEGYKAVWFKEDIDPDAKEEVVIIPDSREDNSDDEDDNGPAKSSKVGFAEADLDSGLGVKMEDPADDSEGDDVLNVDL
ncbi:cadherin-related family member 5 isoform X3 [Syngnathoides biaculeatus]|uniref:cadherin-related family member 5 isoform X3 n=1 Tax=Syngnathoides biaculeatus TaxID=300417 RepID=UPI002ADDB94A|nr:cadherin-related family member 5 isoform X3 [Syngnathoides biaculeatus]